LTAQTANASNRALVRIVIGVLIAMLAIYSAAHIQPSDDAATLAGRVFGILIAVLSLYLIASCLTPEWHRAGLRSHSNTG
jgi:uncharacterized YccA/Bax inhibitor family protein